MRVAVLCLYSKRLNSVGAETVNEFMKIADCYAYQKTMISSSLKNFNGFIGASKIDGDVVQLNTIQRCEWVCKNTDFKPVTAEVFPSMFKLALLASKEKHFSFVY